MKTETIDEMRNELFIALVTIRRVRNDLYDLTRNKQIEVQALRPIRRQLENVQDAVDKAYSHV